MFSLQRITRVTAIALTAGAVTVPVAVTAVTLASRLPLALSRSCFDTESVLIRSR